MSRAVAQPRGAFAPSVTIFVGASVWGLYWLPLREVGGLGLTGPWSVVAFNVVPLLALLPLALWRSRHFARHWRAVLLIGVFSGAGLACYELGLVHTTILRATLLYYLTPIWSTLIAVALIGERITWHRIVAIVVGLSGLVLMLANDSAGTASFIGDAFGLTSGILWGFGATFLRRYRDAQPSETVPAQYLFAFLTALATVLLFRDTAAEWPALGIWLAALPITAFFCIGVITPTIFAIFWAAQYVSPGRVGLLMMSEVVVAAVSAALIAGEWFSPIEGLGAALILMAALIEILGPGEPSWK